MKYEAVFGDQSLFFDAHRDCEMVGNGHHKVENGKLMVWNFSEKYWAESYTNEITIAAMRRIIAEPKCWTVEDQRAGRLPDVGSKAVSVRGFCVVDILAVRNGCVVACNSDVMDSRPCVFTIDNFLELYKPIETPEEKAQRLRDEWCSECTYKYYPRGHKGFPEMIYDALLSGELTMPGKVDE